MARERLTFRTRDLRAALSAAKDAGYSIARIEVGKEGGFVLIVGKPSDSEPAPTARLRNERAVEDAIKEWTE